MGLSRGGHVLKRGIDIVVAGVMLVACLPLLVICAVLIKLDSRGPILFRQARMGRDAKVFSLLKLRTMRAGEDGPRSHFRTRSTNHPRGGSAATLEAG